MARYIAKNIVAAGLADKCQLQLAYAIGVAQPVSVLAETFGTGKISDAALSDLVRACFDLRPAAIIERLGLRRPIYVQTSAYGHFGREELNLPWETVDMTEALLAKAVKNSSIDALVKGAKNYEENRNHGLRLHRPAHRHHVYARRL